MPRYHDAEGQPRGATWCRTHPGACVDYPYGPRPQPHPRGGGGSYGVLYTGGWLQTGLPNGALATVLAAGLPIRIAAWVMQAIGGGSDSPRWQRPDAALQPIMDAGGDALVVLSPADTGALPDPTNWLRYVSQTVGRYPWVQSWELWNEPQPSLDPAAFASLMVASADAIRAANPQARVVGCAFKGGEIAKGGTWTDAALTVALLARLDALSVHFIRSQSTRAAVLADAQAVYGWLRQRTDLPLWVTEVGYSSNPRYQEPAYQGESGQAAWLSDTLPALRQIGYERLFWAALDDTMGGNYPIDSAYGRNGCFEAYPSWAPKDAWSALRGLSA